MTEKTESATDQCADLIALAQVQFVHACHGLVKWHELATTLRRGEDAAMRAAKEDADPTAVTRTSDLADDLDRWGSSLREIEQTTLDQVSRALAREALGMSERRDA